MQAAERYDEALAGLDQDDREAIVVDVGYHDELASAAQLRANGSASKSVVARATTEMEHPG